MGWETMGWRERLLTVSPVTQACEFVEAQHRETIVRSGSSPDRACCPKLPGDGPIFLSVDVEGGQAPCMRSFYLPSLTGVKSLMLKDRG